MQPNLPPRTSAAPKVPPPLPAKPAPKVEYPLTHSSTIPSSIVPPDAPPPTGIAAFGTKIQVFSSVGPPEEFTTIQNVGDITGPNRSIAEVETTSHSTGIPHRTYIPALIDDGDISFPCYWNPSDPTQALSSPYGLENLFENRAVTKWRLVNTDPGQRTREFYGFVKTLGETYPVQGIMTRSTAIRITSTPTDVTPDVTLAPTNATPTNAGGTATFAVTATDSGAWLADTTDDWIHITAPVSPVTGDGVVSYSVDANTPGAAQRVGHISVAGVQFTITQEAGA